MIEQVFLAELVDMMDTEDELVMETCLSDVAEWDSLSHIAFMAFAATKVSKTVTPAQVKGAQTVRDLYELLSE